jgi:hypothetical protein
LNVRYFSDGDAPHGGQGEITRQRAHYGHDQGNNRRFGKTACSINAV